MSGLAVTALFGLLERLLERERETVTNGSKLKQYTRCNQAATVHTADLLAIQEKLILFRFMSCSGFEAAW